MEQYKKVVKKKLELMAGSCGFAAFVIALIGASGNIIVRTSEPISDMINGVQVGIFIGLELSMLYFIAKYRKALKTEDELKKLYIEEHDERTKLIRNKIGGVGFNFSLGAIATATIMAGFLNQMVFITLLGVLCFMAIVKGCLKVYYRNKF